MAEDACVPGSNYVWQDVSGTPFNGGVYALAVYDGELYAGGGFTNAEYPYIVRWNGTSWNDAGGTPFNFYVLALTVYNGELYAGGGFTDLTHPYIARWTPLCEVIPDEPEQSPEDGIAAS